MFQPNPLVFENTSTGQLGDIQDWEVPETGDYLIAAFGARGGGNYNSQVGGAGAKMSGFFSLVQGEDLKVLVGQQGTPGVNVTYNRGGGGGGGSFVWKDDIDKTLLLAAGGGGGCAYDANGNDATIVAAPSGGSGGDGEGGLGAGVNGSGGAGWNSNGVNGSYSEGGKTPLNGGAGGRGRYTTNTDAYGGFGGGGGGANGGGGGGGYSGGGGSAHGAGSYNGGTDQSNEAGATFGEGSVEILRYYDGRLNTTFFSLTTDYVPRVLSANFFELTIGGAPIGPTIKVYIGGVWVEKPIKTFLSGTWEDKPVKVRVGGVWVDI